MKDRRQPKGMPAAMSLLAILALLGSLLPGGYQAAYAEGVAAPRLVVSVAHNWLEVQNFPAGALVNLAVYASADPGAAVLWQAEKTADDSGWVFVGDWEHLLDLSPGQLVVANDGTTLRELVLEPITLDVFDAAADYLAGTAPLAPGGRLVWVGTGNALSGCSMLVTADAGTGAWAADFSTQPCDVTDDMWGAAQVFDADGDATEANPVAPPPTPWLTAFPVNDAVEGWEWPEGASVHLSIDDPATGTSPDFEADGVAQGMWWGGTYFRIEFGGAYDLKAGDTVMLADGATTATHVVRNLAITGVDIGADTVAGTADPGTWLQTWAHEQTAPWLEMTAGDDGTWLADFTGTFDIVPGTGGRARIPDEHNNATEVDWSAPPPPPTPWLTAYPEWEYVEAVDWAVGVPVHLAIDDPGTPDSPDYQADTTTFIPEWESNPERGWALFPLEGYDLKAGDVVVMTGDGFMLEHNVRNLSITAVDIDANTVAGSADAGAVVHVNPYEAWDQVVQATVGEDGYWLADFTGVFDFAGVSGGRSQIFDEAGNRTAVDWSVPPPPTAYLRALPDQEFVDGWNWPLDAVVHLAIDDPGTGPGVDYEQDATVIVSPWDPTATFVLFEFAGAYDLKRGDAVSLSSDGIVRELVVPFVWITSVDSAADTVAGTADAGEWVHVFIGGDAELFVTADEGGNWLADFAGIGFDLQPWMDIAAGVWDDDGDSAIFNWWGVPPPPTPWLIAFPENEAIEGWEWPLGATVHLTIDDPATGEGIDFEADGVAAETWWGDPRTYFRLDFGGAYDLKVGDIVTLSDGTATATHVVQVLAITGVDIAADTVAGIANPLEQLQVWAHEQSEPPVDVMADDAGNWLADLAGVVDIVPGMGGRSWIVGEGGNATAVDWWVPYPWFTAFPEWEAVEGWEWPLGATVHLNVDDPATPGAADFALDAVVILAPWGSGQHWVWFDLAGYDLKPGDEVVLSDGVTIRTHVVRNLAVTNANGASDRVMGTADPGAGLQVWAHEQAAPWLELTANAEGKWQANFVGVVDLVVGTAGRAQIMDEEGNTTAVDWVVSSPPPAPPPVGGIKTPVRLPADAGWMDTGFTVAEGVPVVITAHGQAITARLKDYPDALSGPDGQITNCWDFDGQSPCALDGAPYGALIGRIGPDGEPFLIGSSFVLYPNASGILYLAVNDNLPWYGDNKGNFMVFLSD